MDKQYITKELESIGSDLEGPVDEAIDFLRNLFVKYPDHKNLKLDFTYAWSDERELFLLGDRLETDKEYNKRKEIEAKVAIYNQQKKEKKEKAEKLLFAELKKKYG